MEGESSLVKRQTGKISKGKDTRYNLRKRLERYAESSDQSEGESSVESMEVEHERVGSYPSTLGAPLELGLSSEDPERTPRVSALPHLNTPRFRSPQPSRNSPKRHLSDPVTQQTVLDEVIRQGVAEVKKQAAYLEETVAEVKRQKLEIEMTRRLVLEAVNEVKNHQDEIKVQHDALKILIDQSVKVQDEIRTLLADCQTKVQLLHQALTDQDN